MNEIIEYRGEKIEIIGNGYLYEGLLWPKLISVHTFIDNELDGTKKSITFENDYFPKPPPPKFYWPPPNLPKDENP